MPYCPSCGNYITEREKKDGTHRCPVKDDDPIVPLVTNDPVYIPDPVQYDPIPNPAPDPTPDPPDFGGGDFGGGGASGDY